MLKGFVDVDASEFFERVAPDSVTRGHRYQLVFPSLRINVIFTASGCFYFYSLRLLLFLQPQVALFLQPQVALFLQPQVPFILQPQVAFILQPQVVFIFTASGSLSFYSLKYSLSLQPQVVFIFAVVTK